MTTKTLETKIKPFSNQGEGKEPDKTQEVKREIATESMIEQYKDMLSLRARADRMAEQYEKRLSLDTLNPAEINLLLQKMMSVMPISETEKKKTGSFISGLIQKSYEAGHDKFILNTQDRIIPMLGYGLKGTPERNIQIMIQGSTGEGCGTYSINCIYDIQGDTGDWCGSFSRNCTFNIQGKVGNQCSERSSNCVFTTPNKETYLAIKAQLPTLDDIFFFWERTKVRYTGK